MSDPDQAIEALRAIIVDFADFCDAHGGASEADTRAKVIDAMLCDVLGWPEASISREDRVVRVSDTDDTKNTYMDYCLKVLNRRHVVVEAKREGIEFVFPEGGRKTYTLNGALVSDDNIKSAIYQVRGYCDDEAIRFAIATNGYSWIVFRAVRDDMPWRKGHARIFPSLDYIVENFTEFYNLLCFEAVERGSLESTFTPTLRPSRHLHRVVSHLFNADVPLQRNRLNSDLQPWIKLVFEDIADQEHIEVLEKCYVHTGSLQRVANELGGMFLELIPKFLYEQGTRSVGEPEDERGFERTFQRILYATKGELFLLLGAIGSGKTTFLKRYQRTAGAEILREKALWFMMDFLKAPTDPNKMEDFVWESALNELRSRYKDRDFERRRHLHDVFESDIASLESTVLQNIKRGSYKYNDIVGTYLYEWQKNVPGYVPKLLRSTCQREKLVSVLFIDNVDQLPPPYQAQIFLLAQRVVREISAIAIVAMREESYYSPTVQRQFTAFTNRKFLIAAPLFRRMIGQRIQYAVRKLNEQRNQSGNLEGNWRR